MHTWHEAIPEAFPNWPAKHGLHSTAPGAIETNPGAQDAHVDEPVEFAYVPALHGSQFVAPESACCPAEHGTQIVSTVVAPMSMANSPVLHTCFAVQLLRPTASEK